MRRHLVLLSGCVTVVLGGCAPSLHSLVQQRRFADGICLASDETEARLVAREALRALGPKVHVHAVTPSEWHALLGPERGQHAADSTFAVRTAWAYNTISVGHTAMAMYVTVSEDDRHQSVPLIDSYEGRRVVARATGERLPERTAVTTYKPRPSPRDPIGWILSLVYPIGSRRTTELDPSEAVYAAANPKASSLVHALNDGDKVAGYALEADKVSSAALHARIALLDRVDRDCRLDIGTELEVGFGGRDAVRAVNESFGEGFRVLASVPGKTHVTLSNPFGYWYWDE